MRRTFTVAATILVLVGIQACGSNGILSKILGPILSVADMPQVIVDQFYINGGLEGEYASKGDFSIYLRDAASGKDVACTSAAAGMSELSSAGVYYGELSIPLGEVTGDHPTSLAKFQVVFVEKDDEGCPKPIGSGDNIVGISQEFNFDALLNQPIWATNGKASLVFRQAVDEKGFVSSMVPGQKASLIIDKLYFEDGSDSAKDYKYYLFASSMVGGKISYECQIEDSLIKNIRHGGLLYAALDFPFACFEEEDAGFASTTVSLGLWIQRDSGPELIAETEAKAIGDLIGEKVSFTNGRGYVTFRSVMSQMFSTSKVRLADIEKLAVKTLSYVPNPSEGVVPELFVINEDGYVVACAGEHQGLTGINKSGSYDGLTADFVAVEGQKELFGWDKVKISLVERTDGLACPKAVTTAPMVLTSTKALTNDELALLTLSFLDGDGSVGFAISE